MYRKLQKNIFNCKLSKKREDVDFTIELFKLTSVSVPGDRMNNFIVGLTNNPPSSTYPNAQATTFTSYTLCGQWPGIAPAGQKLLVQCAAGLSPFRYIVVLNHQPYLTMCELQAFVTGLPSCRLQSLFVF